MNSQTLANVNSFIKNRLIECLGISIIISSIFIFLSILSYSPNDPNFIYSPENIEIKNFGGFYGSVISDFLLQAIGIVCFFLLFNLFYWGFKLIYKKKINSFISKSFYTLLYIICATTFVNIFLYSENVVFFSTFSL